MRTRFSIMTLSLLLLAASAFAAGAANPFIGAWALTIPGGGAGWLGVVEKDGALSASILWGGGSVVPVQEVKVDGDKLIVTRLHRSEKKDAAGNVTRITTTETITATIDGDTLNLTTVKRQGDGPESGKATFTGKRQPPLPATPDLSKVKFGEPVSLFNGRDLTGWRLVDQIGRAHV